MSESKSTSAGLGWLFWSFLWGCVGYLHYGTVEGALSLAFFSAVTGLTAILGILPILGTIGTYFANQYILNWLLLRVEMSWAFSVIFGASVFFSVVITVIAIVFVLIMLGRRF